MHFRPSFWELETFYRPYDVIIVGSGIVGLNAAISMAQKHPGLRIAVVERGAIPTGASTRNAGFACFGSPSEILADIRSTSATEAFELVTLRYQGFKMLMDRIGDRDIGYVASGGAEIFLEEDEEYYAECMDLIPTANDALRDVFGADLFDPADERLGDTGLASARHMVWHPFEGQLHPGKLVSALLDIAKAAGISLINGFNISEIAYSGKHVEFIDTRGPVLQARYGIIATNGFARNLLPGLEVTPARNLVLVTEPLRGLKLKGCFHYNEGYVYFRDVGQRLLIGGARHVDLEVEATEQFGVNDQIYAWLTRFLEEHILGRKVAIEYKWSGIMGLGTVKSPIIDMVSDRLAVAVRLGGMGVAIGARVGDEAASLIAERL